MGHFYAAIAIAILTINFACGDFSESKAIVAKCQQAVLGGM
jgi:hypothetical protein